MFSLMIATDSRISVKVLVSCVVSNGKRNAFTSYSKKVSLEHRYRSSNGRSISMKMFLVNFLTV